MYLYSLPQTYEGTIVKRPCKTCASPYVADVYLQDPEIEENEKHIIAHAPSLGCCGYVDAQQSIVLIKHENPKLCTHVIHLAKRQEKGQTYLIGVHPKSAEKIVSLCLEKGVISSLESITQLEREKCFINSRFDFLYLDKDAKKTIIEVKNVPCADYEDIESKERKKKDYSSYTYDSKIAYFPDGYRKKKNTTVSPRALKHVEELEQLKLEHPEYRTILIFVIQRQDVKSFQASLCDPIYKSAVSRAYENGVEIIPIQVHWNNDGRCYYDRVLPFIV